MSTPQRLPIVNSDDGTWGDILRQYVMKEHYNDDTDNAANGGHQTITIRPGTSAAGTAPLKFSSGTLTTAAEAGAMEFNTDSLYFTITTGNTRKKVALYDDSLGATGDLYYRNSSGIFTRLPIGAAGKILQSSGTVPAWTDPRINTTATTSVDYFVSATDTVIFADASGGSVGIELPSVSAFAGYRFDIKRLDSSGYSLSVYGPGSETVDGEGQYELRGQYTAVTVISNGSDWYIL